ncbi:hypothetical protein GCWU000325_01581 [Alloprevotella tannerae ATCC 51259]|uniref:Uncharacterized protein n=1 Tax=Alloprevotella tannerae ATCC 51259 TaxID=626522 RepID=C9LH80_9BACT|nr:hypothetical protein GCWU000325_01581 [Alloprevotella tannerae ATCC 51259]
MLTCNVNTASEHSKIVNPIGLVFQNKRMSVGRKRKRPTLRGYGTKKTSHTAL